jgi:WD40 repeat protein
MRELTNVVELTRETVEKMQITGFKQKKTPAEGFESRFFLSAFFFSLSSCFAEVLELVQMSCKGTFTGHNGAVWALALTNEGKNLHTRSITLSHIRLHLFVPLLRVGLLVSASKDMTIKIWDVPNFKCKQTLTGHEGIVHSVVVHGKKLCSGSSDKSIRVS